jgi:AhpD family alkylhydroperoxidase
MKAIQLNPKTAIAPKYKELIGLAVASQIPCTYCTQFHSEAAKLNGGNEAELQEAVAVASCARHWSTFFNGTLTDEARFRSDVDTIMAKMKERTTKSNEKAAASTVSVNTPEEALTDIEQTLGIVPEFIRAFPKEGLAAAWNDLKSLELNANTAIPSRQKALISLAVDAQVPCRYCVYWDTASAKAEGATDQEISEAVALASITRKWSTVLNGVRTDPESFSKEVAQIIAHGKEQKTVQ